jgi:hypothetical protein
MHLKLRLASTVHIERELARVTAFYGQNTSQYVRERDPQILKEAIGRSSVLLLEDERKIIQGSCVQISHGEGLYSETGAVRILINGFGLQTIMMGICAINEYIFSPPSDSIFAITAADNEPSLKSIQRSGFVPDLPGRDLLHTIGYSGEFPDTKRFFRFQREEALPVRDKLLLLRSTGELRRASSTISITVEHPLFLPANITLLEQIWCNNVAYCAQQ